MNIIIISNRNPIMFKYGGVCYLIDFDVAIYKMYRGKFIDLSENEKNVNLNDVEALSKYILYREERTKC